MAKPIWPKKFNKPGHTTLFARHIPRKLYIRFQAWCKLRGITFTQKLIEMMRSAIQDTSNPEPIRRSAVVLKRWDKGNRTISVRQIPLSLLRHFQAWCMLRDITPAEKLISMMEVIVQSTDPEKLDGTTNGDHK